MGVSRRDHRSDRSWLVEIDSGARRCDDGRRDRPDTHGGKHPDQDSRDAAMDAGRTSAHLSVGSKLIVTARATEVARSRSSSPGHDEADVYSSRGSAAAIWNGG